MVSINGVIVKSLATINLKQQLAKHSFWEIISVLVVLQLQEE